MTLSGLMSEIASILALHNKSSGFSEAELTDASGNRIVSLSFILNSESFFFIFWLLQNLFPFHRLEFGA